MDNQLVTDRCAEVPMGREARKKEFGILLAKIDEAIPERLLLNIRQHFA